MSEQDFMNRIEGCLNDYDAGISTRKEIYDAIMDTILELVKPKQERIAELELDNRILKTNEAMLGAKLAETETELAKYVETAQKEQTTVIDGWLTRCKELEAQSASLNGRIDGYKDRIVELEAENNQLKDNAIKLGAETINKHYQILELEAEVERQTRNVQLVKVIEDELRTMLKQSVEKHQKLIDALTEITEKKIEFNGIEHLTMHIHKLIEECK